jgi:heterodisulfide reductase subunit B2
MPVDYPSRTECCGSYLGVGAPDAMMLLSRNVVQTARSYGAKLLTVSCPLCKYNLEESQKQDPAASSSSQSLPVVYFTQLLGLALGVTPEDLRLNDTQLQTIRGGARDVVESVSRP